MELKININLVQLIFIFIGPGISACTYYGSSNGSILSVSKLPKECTSFVWDGLFADVRNNVQYKSEDASKGI
jgi:hypothetical protein